MSNNLVKDVEVLLNSKNLDSKDDKMRSFEEGMEMLKDLQEKGLTKPPGNRLMDLEQRVKAKNHFNQPNQPLFY